MGQSKWASVAETIADTVTGYLLAVWAQAYIFPLYGFNPPLHDTFAMAAIFTVISMARKYFFRRLFNASPWRKYKERS